MTGAENKRPKVRILGTFRTFSTLSFGFCSRAARTSLSFQRRGQPGELLDSGVVGHARFLS
jgi:hypothetical protein